ncbi:MAG: M28 family peptidase, partial [Deltaproteobacteria bacterium]|nr:M28 family peptidase [Deltaproteobacteria bacterium]
TPAPVATAEAPVAAPLPPLVAEEAALVAPLTSLVERLTRAGRRTPEDPLGLATATDDLALALEAQGLSVNRRGYEAGGGVVQNLEVVVPGGRRGKEVVVVAAHYDGSAAGPSADDATGAAVLVTLAQALRGARPDRTVRLAWYATSAASGAPASQTGSEAHVRALLAEGAQVVAMIAVDGVGRYGPAARGGVAPGRGPVLPAAGDFLAITSSGEERELPRRVTAELSRESSLPVVGELREEDLPGLGTGDHLAFSRARVPAVQLTDTGAARDPGHRGAGDLAATLDLERVARLAHALPRVVLTLATEPDASGGQPP